MHHFTPSKEYQERQTELHRLKTSLRLLRMGCYPWMHQPAIALLQREVEVLTKKQYPDEKK